MSADEIHVAMYTRCVHCGRHYRDISGHYAAEHPPRLPAYRPTVVYSCPDCDSDLDDEAFSKYCRACKRTVSFAEMIPHLEPDVDD